jgi:hypothetical protein
VTTSGALRAGAGRYLPAAGSSVDRAIRVSEVESFEGKPIQTA